MLSVLWFCPSLTAWPSFYTVVSYVPYMSSSMKMAAVKVIFTLSQFINMLDTVHFVITAIALVTTFLYWFFPSVINHDIYYGCCLGPYIFPLGYYHPSLRSSRDLLYCQSDELMVFSLFTLRVKQSVGDRKDGGKLEVSCDRDDFKMV